MARINGRAFDLPTKWRQIERKKVITATIADEDLLHAILILLAPAFYAPVN